MMKKIIKNQKGISLLTLSITVIVLLIVTNIVIFNVRDNIVIKNLEAMQNDISNLREKIDSYYNQYGEIPAKYEYTPTNMGEAVGVNDKGKYYVIDLNALENLTLNYGKDYEKINSNITDNSLNDVYIINENSHNIFYAKGININGEMYYTDYKQGDKEEVKMQDDSTNGLWTEKYDQMGKYTDKEQNIAYIPKGFKVSKAPGEDTISKGLVVKAQDDSEFVWVPIAKRETVWDKGQTITSKLYTPISSIYNYNSKDLYQGIFYSFSGIMSTYNNTEQVGTTNTREPSLVTGNTSDTYATYPTNVNIKGSNFDGGNSFYNGVLGFSNAKQFGEQMQNDYDEMIQSIEKYGGFYVGRYETGSNGKSIKQAPATNQNWYNLYKIQRQYANNSEDISSSMIWGSQWDAILNWALRGDNQNKVTAENIGNYGTSVSSTGNTANDKINNIFDLSGNVREWTLAASGADSRVVRGGGSNSKGSASKIDKAQPSGANASIGSRMILYLK